MKKINISQIDTLFVNGSYPIELLFYNKHKIKTLPIRKAIKNMSVLASVSKSSYAPFKKYAIRPLASPQLKRTVLKEYHFNKTKIVQSSLNKD